MPQPVDNRPFLTAWNHHYTAQYFNDNIAPRIIGAGGVAWADASGLQTCAIRMSIALAYAGVSWQPVETNNVWRLQGTRVLFPSLAADYPDVPLLANRESIQTAAEISGRSGVIFFGPFTGASGHVTLWNGAQCHHNDAYWSATNKWFWEMNVPGSA